MSAGLFGEEPWSMGDDPDDERRARSGAQTEDELFRRVKELLP